MTTNMPAGQLLDAARKALAAIDLGHLPSVLDSPDFIVPEAEPAPLPTASPHPVSPSVPVEYWEAIAYDLALETADEDLLAERLGLPTEDVRALHDNPFFAKLLAEKRTEIASLDENAGFTVAYRMIANRASSHFLRRLTDPATTDRDFLNLFKHAVELARLKPPEAAPQPAAQATVMFNIQGVPGLEHLNPGGVTIEHEPSPGAG